MYLAKLKDDLQRENANHIQLKSLLGRIDSYSFPPYPWQRKAIPTIINKLGHVINSANKEIFACCQKKNTPKPIKIIPGKIRWFFINDNPFSIVFLNNTHLFVNVHKKELYFFV